VFKSCLRFLSNWYVTPGRKIFVKLILIIIVPNLLLIGIIHQLISQQIDNKLAEMDTVLYNLHHATGREIRALFNDVMTLTNQILIEPEVQRIMSAALSLSSERESVSTEAESKERMRNKYVDRETLRLILSRYRLGWNNVYSIAVIDSNREIYLNTADNYQIDATDLSRSALFRDLVTSAETGLFWSVDDALAKNNDMITLGRKIFGVNNPQVVIGYVIVNISLDKIRDSFDTYNYYGQMIFGLTNKTNTNWMIYDGGKITGGHEKLPVDLTLGHPTAMREIELSGRTWKMVSKPFNQQDYLFAGVDLVYIRNESLAVRRQLYFGYFFFLVLTFLISLIGARKLSRRLGALIKAMRTFASQEQWGTRIELKGNDEISMLGDKFNVMASRIEQLVNDLQEEQRLKRLFELRVLEYQINPHFLYNTLDSIHWLAQENRQQKISDMVNGLSKLFRIILSKGKEMISMAEEFEMVGVYLRIQKIRFEDRFDYRLELEPGVADYLISKLILQPLVENSLLHGIRKLRTTGLIVVTGKRNRDEIVLEIADNGVGMTEEQMARQKELFQSEVLEENIISSHGYGMKNVDSRLKLVYGNNYRMEMESDTGEHHGTRIRICIKESAMKRVNRLSKNFLET